MTGFSDTFLSKLSGADCASLRLSSANVLFYKAVACWFAAIFGENSIENPRVRGSIPRLATRIQAASRDGGRFHF